MRRELASAFRAASVLLASVVPLRAAHADPPPSLRVVGLDTACPTARQVATVLERMLPRTKITADTGPPGAADATVSDQGAHFQVTVAGQERSFDDAARQCSERARHVAVFIALVLDPPMIAEPVPRCACDSSFTGSTALETTRAPERPAKPMAVGPDPRRGHARRASGRAPGDDRGPRRRGVHASQARIPSGIWRGRSARRASLRPSGRRRLVDSDRRRGRLHHQGDGVGIRGGARP